MTTLYISEYAGLGWVGLSSNQLAQLTPSPALVEQHLAIGVASVQSAAFSVNTRVIRVNADAACSLAFGKDPTAVATEHRMSSNESAYYAVNPGDKIAVITNS